MKNLLKISLMSLAFVATFFLSCTKSNQDLDSNLGDAELILAIENSKELVQISEVPVAVGQVLESEYFESYTEKASKAEKLGYKVQLRVREGSMAGEQTCVYFNMNGRELDGEESGNRERMRERTRERIRMREMMRDCFTFEFPVTFIMPDETEIVIPDADSWSLLKDWHQANPDIKERGTIVYPVVVIFDDGTQLTVTSEEEMQEIREDCKEAAQMIRERRRDHDQNNMGSKCFEFVYPITVILPDASEVVIEEKGDNDEVKAWYELNPDVEEMPILKFPVDVVYEDGTTVTVNSKEEMKELKDDCEDSDSENNNQGQKGGSKNKGN